MKKPNGAIVVCQACASKEQRLTARFNQGLSAAWRLLRNPRLVLDIPDETLDTHMLQLNELHRARYHVLHGCTHLN